MKTKQAFAFLSLILALVVQAAAVDITANTPPIVTGSGVGMTARFPNVGTLDGTSLDVFAEILSYSPAGKPCVFDVVDDDMFFQFTGGSTGMERNATIRWTFFESGTSTPVTIPNFSFTVDDLDNLPTRRESLTTANATGFELNNPTNVTAALAGSTVTATGGIEQNSGDPEGAVKLHFASKSSVQISYNTIHGSALVSAYHHDGNDEFSFPNPEYTPMPKPLDCSLPRLYYTYHFHNNGYVPVLTNFSNKLEEGMVWDTGYTPKVTGSLEIQIDYEKQNREALIPLLWLPPGDSSLTLCTFDVEQSGEIENEAKIKMFKPNPPKPLDPTHPANWHKGQTTSANITLEPMDAARQFICRFKNSPLCGYSLFKFGAGNVTMTGSSSVLGTVALGSGASPNMNSNITIAGPIYIDAPAGLPPIGTKDQNGVPTVVIPRSLEATAAQVIELSSLATALPVTNSSINTLGNGGAINVTGAPGDFHVFQLAAIQLSGSNVATLTGGPDDWLILNVGEVTLTGSSRIVVNGFSPGRVLVNLTSANSKEVRLTGGASTLPLTILAPNRGFSATGSTVLNGAAYVGGNVSLTGTPRINGSLTFGCESPCCGG